MDKDIDTRKIDLNLLYVFEVIYMTKNITKAATRLNLSQPTVSNALSRLRSQFNDPLFYRSDKGVAPTAFADQLIHPVRQALDILREGIELKSDFDLARANRTFRLAMNEFTAATFLPDILAEIDRHAPNIRLEIVTQDWLRPFDSLTTGEADMALDVFPNEEGGITLYPAHTVHAVCVARQGHPLINGALTKEVYSTVGHVVVPLPARLRTYMEALMLTNGIQRRVVCEVRHGSDLPPIVARTDLVALLPIRFAEMTAPYHNLQILPVPFPYPTMRLHIGVLTERISDPGLQWLKRSLLRAIGEEQGDQPAALNGDSRAASRDRG